MSSKGFGGFQVSPMAVFLQIVSPTQWATTVKVIIHRQESGPSTL